MRTGNSKHPPTSACSSAPLGAAGVRRLEGVKQLQVMWTVDGKKVQATD